MISPPNYRRAHASPSLQGGARGRSGLHPALPAAPGTTMPALTSMHSWAGAAKKQGLLGSRGLLGKGWRDHSPPRRKERAGFSILFSAALRLCARIRVLLPPRRKERQGFSILFSAALREEKNSFTAEPRPPINRRAICLRPLKRAKPTSR
jgi:hypothetical protein